MHCIIMCKLYYFLHCAPLQWMEHVHPCSEWSKLSSTECWDGIGVQKWLSWPVIWWGWTDQEACIYPCIQPITLHACNFILKWNESHEALWSSTLSLVGMWGCLNCILQGMKLCSRVWSWCMWAPSWSPWIYTLYLVPIYGWAARCERLQSYS